MPVFLRSLLRLGPTNPIAVRLVQGGSRRTRHFYIRAAYLGVLIVVLLWILLLAGSGELDYRKLAAKGAEAFTLVAYLQVALICILAPVFMAGAIAQEASPRTWDILLTTPLSASQVVLGNLLGRLFFIVALLLSSLPLFAVTQYFGGVPGRSIFLSYLIATCAALVVAAAAVALSVSRLVGKRAVFAFYVAVVSYLAVTLAIDAIVSRGGVTWMTAINPFLALRALLNPTGYPPAPAGTLTGLGAFMLESPVRAWCVLSIGLSLVLITASVFTVRAGGLSSLAGIGKTSKTPWYRRMFGLAASGSEHRAPKAVWHNPIAWREAAARNATLGKMIARWSFIAVGALFAIGLVLYFHGGSLPPAGFRLILLYCVIGELAVIALVAVNMAATSIAREREDGTLDLLLTTPITPGQYLSGKLRGMIAYLLPMLAIPIGMVALAGLYAGGGELGLIDRAGAAAAGADPGSSLAVNYTPPGSGVTYLIPVVLPEAAIVATAVTVPFIALCVMIGMQRSMGSRGSLGSVVAGIVGLCGWKAGADLPVIGPAVAAMSPATAAYALIEPEHALNYTLNNQGVGAARTSLFIGSLIAAAVFTGAVYGLHAQMVRTFDFTVRKLAGAK